MLLKAAKVAPKPSLCRRQSVLMMQFDVDCCRSISIMEAPSNLKEGMSFCRNSPAIGSSLSPQLHTTMPACAISHPWPNPSPSLSDDGTTYHILKYWRQYSSWFLRSRPPVYLSQRFSVDSIVASSAPLSLLSTNPFVLPLTSSLSAIFLLCPQ